jgi:ABC-type nitrate/sulfonate/bicarbonate transport system substrate-binding protein
MITRRSLAAGALATLAAPTLVIRRANAAETWRHAIFAAKGDAGFYYMAKRKGFWEKRGLEVEIIELKGSKDVMRAVLAGEADSADPTPGDALPAIEKGADIKFVGSGIEGYPYAMYVRPEIKSWADLAGKTFGVSAPGSAPHIFALAMLEANKVPIDNIQIASTGGTTSRIKALSAGKLDATAASTEFVPLAEELKIKVLGFAKDVAPMYPRNYEVMTSKTIQTRSAAAVNFLAAYMEGLRYCAEHRDETIQLSAEINQEKPDDPRYGYSYDEIVRGGLLSLNMEIHRDKIAWMQEMMLRVKELQKAVNVDATIDTSLRDKALQIVGTR